MRAGKYFDHILGEQNSIVDMEAQKLVKEYILNHKENQNDKDILDRMRIGLTIEMWEYLNSKKNTDYIVTGQFLNRLLGIYKITKTKFSDFIDIERTNLHAIIKGDRRFNSSLAKKVEQIFNIPAELWLHIETKNDLRKFEKKNSKIKLNYSLDKLMHVR